MPDETVTLDKAPEPDSEIDWSKKFVIRSIKDAPLVPGRRDFFLYRDLGLKHGTDGKVSANVTIVTNANSKPTGWHYHTCDVQFSIMLKGWFELQMEDGTTRRVNEGDTIFLKGGTKHNEIATSEEFEFIEILIPAQMDTVPCDPPETWLKARAAEQKT